jgi:hypothetical protein
MNESRFTFIPRFRMMPILVLPIFFLLSIILAPLFVSASSLRVGDKSPQFEIQGFNSEKLIGEKNILLIFYRGHF